LQGRVAGCALFLALVLLLSSCGDQGPVDLLSNENLSLTVPSALEAWPTEPGDGYWKDAETDSGQPALLHEGARGADSSSAWAETGWRLTPFPPPTVRTACEAFLELVAANMQPAGAGAASREALTRCIDGLGSGQEMSRSWPITLEDGSPAQMSVTMASVQDQGEYWVTIATSEQ
jgi:hypothetical protein